MASVRKRLVVIGAGIVGTSCALALAMRGHRVTMIDPEPPGHGASFGNAGGLSAGSIVPLSGPGALRQVPKWLRDPLGPLSIRWSYLPRLAPWLIRFARAGTPGNVEQQAKALRDLNGPVLSAYAPLIKAANADDLIKCEGHLTVYRSAAAFERDRAAWMLRERFGIECYELGRDEIRQMEPALAHSYERAMYIPENGHCTDPRRLVERFSEALVRYGGEVLRERAVGFVGAQERAVAIQTDRAQHAADGFIIAAGAWSGALAAEIGDRVPLESERGYHVTICGADVNLCRPVLDGEAKFAVTSMAMGLRLAGTVELAGLRAAPDWRRAHRLLELGRTMFPKLPASIPEDKLSIWMGHRPSLPDSLPVIGRASRVANVWHAFGHGHTGLTGAPMTARTIADLVDGRAPPIDIAPFRPDRFRRGQPPRFMACRPDPISDRR